MGKEPSLSQQVVEALLNNETYFFRDRAPFDLLAAPRAARACQDAAPEAEAAAHLVGRLLDRARKSIRWRCCSPKQPEQWRGWTIDILGTDVSTACIDRARSGAYTQFEVQRGLGINQMINWFEEVADGWRAVEALRKPVRFQVHNLLEPPPHPGRVRHRPVPQRPALPQPGQEGARVRAAWPAAWPRTAG